MPSTSPCSWPGCRARRAWRRGGCERRRALSPGLAALDATSHPTPVTRSAPGSASRLREPDQARVQLERLKKRVGQDPEAATQVRWLGMELALAAGDLARQRQFAAGGDGTQSAWTGALRRPELLLQAQVAVQSGQGDALNQAAQQLQTWVSREPLDAMAWQTLANLYAAQGRSLRALRAEAEARVAHLDHAGALDRLKGAQDRLRGLDPANSSADHIDASIIDTRRRQIEALLREQALER